jgi:hypothetical protein
MSNLSRKLTWGMGLLAMVWLVGGTACLEETPGVCSADIVAEVNSLQAAADALIAASDSLKQEVVTACYNIASDLDVPDLEPIPAEITDEYIETVCTAAADAINAQVAAGVTVDVIVQGGYCEIDAQAQLDCEAECQVQGQCDPGSIETRCDPGYLSVECNGACEAEAYCQGSVEVEANCSGTCAGMCKGTCDGAEAPGDGVECAGRCEGTCTGECHLAADASIECGASVRCRGGCTTDYEAPRCETTIEEPTCDVSADCNAGCQGQASFEATCYEPEVLVLVTGAPDEDFITTIETNFPIIYNAFAVYGPMIVQSSVDVAAAAGRVANAAGETTLCSILVAGDTALALAGAYEASVTIDVTVNVSASVGTELAVE